MVEQENAVNLKVLQNGKTVFIHSAEGKDPETGAEDPLSKDNHPGLIDDREESEPSDEEFATFPSEGRAEIVEEKEKPTAPEEGGDLFFEANFETPSVRPQESRLEDHVDLLGLNADVPPEQNPPASEMKSSSSNADLLNNLFVGGTSQISEESTGDLLGEGADFFFSNQPQPSASNQRTSPTATLSSAGM